MLWFKVFVFCNCHLSRECALHFCELYRPDSVEGLECHLGAMEIEAMEEDLFKKIKIKKNHLFKPI